MKKYFLLLALLFSVSAFSESLKPVEFPDQFDTKSKIDESVQWLIFSQDKDVSDKINQALNELKITDVASLKGQYVADISKMPGLVTTMFAIPKMKTYSFKLLLDKEGEATKNWPRQSGKASLLKLKNLEVTEVRHSDSVEEIKKFVQSQLPVAK